MSPCNALSGFNSSQWCPLVYHVSLIGQFLLRYLDLTLPTIQVDSNIFSSLVYIHNKIQKNNKQLTYVKHLLSITFEVNDPSEGFLFGTFTISQIHTNVLFSWTQFLLLGRLAPIPAG